MSARDCYLQEVRHREVHHLELHHLDVQDQEDHHLEVHRFEDRHQEVQTPDRYLNLAASSAFAPGDAVA